MKSNIGWYLLFAMVSFSCFASERSEQAWQKVNEGALLIDVRTPDEFNQEHLVNAINKPLNTVNESFSHIKKETPIVVYCRSGNRSGKAMSYLNSIGFSQVYNGGGLEEMRSSKSPQ